MRIYDMRHIQTGPYLLKTDLSQGFRDVPVCHRLGHQEGDLPAFPGYK